MGLVRIVVTIIVVGVLVWLEETYIPLPAVFKTIIRVVVVMVVLIWLLNVFGVLR
jgi:hypothetical protein